MTYSVFEVVDKPRLVQETTVLDLLHGVLVDKAESTVDSLVDDLDGQVLAGSKINPLVDVRVMTLAEDLTLEQLVVVSKDLCLFEPVVFGL
jgi:hypothetical protein